MQHLDLVLSLAATVGAATWALRSKLSDIERAISGHVRDDEEKHTEQDAKILKLERRRR